jgi:hypothetical protein
VGCINGLNDRQQLCAVRVLKLEGCQYSWEVTVDQLSRAFSCASSQLDVLQVYWYYRHANEYRPDLEGVSTVFAALTALPQLKTLDLANCRLGDEGIVLLCKAIAAGALPNLAMLVLERCHVGDAGLVTVAQSLLHMPKLVGLTLSNNSFGSDGICTLAKVLPSAPRLAMIVMRFAQADEAGAYRVL